jgi:hypothetical protein
LSSRSPLVELEAGNVAPCLFDGAIDAAVLPESDSLPATRISDCL